MEKTYYQILNISPSATAAELKKAFHQLAKKYHPDVQATGNAEIFREINEAYEVLSNPLTRREYDNKLKIIQQQEEIDKQSKAFDASLEEILKNYEEINKKYQDFEKRFNKKNNDKIKNKEDLANDSFYQSVKKLSRSLTKELKENPKQPKEFTALYNIALQYLMQKENGYVPEETIDALDKASAAYYKKMTKPRKKPQTRRSGKSSRRTKSHSTITEKLATFIRWFIITGFILALLEAITK